MSDKELIEKIEDAYRRVRKIGPDAIYETELREVLRAAADALEAATRVPVQGEPNDDREALIDKIVMTDLSDFAGTDMSMINAAADAILAAGFSRATVPDAATEAKQPEGWSTEDRQEAKREAERRWSRSAMRYAEQRYQAGNINGFMLGAEWQKARETFISYKAIADKARAERAAAARALEDAADEIESRRNVPGLVYLDVRYAGYYTGIRSGMESDSKALRARAAEIREGKETRDDY